MNKTFIASTMALAITCVCWPVHARDEAAAADAIAGRGKMTKADAARSAPLDPRPSSSTSAASYTATGRGAQPHRQPPGAKDEPEDETAARGIEKKDIRRGMVIAKPGAITPHSMQAVPSQQGAEGETEVSASARGKGSEDRTPMTASGRAQTPSSPEQQRTRHDTVKNSISNVR